MMSSRVELPERAIWKDTPPAAHTLTHTELLQIQPAAASPQPGHMMEKSIMCARISDGAADLDKRWPTRLYVL